MQTILIPTNFDISSIDCIPAVCDQFEGQDLKFIFMHMFKLSDSISELLMLSKRSRDHAQISEEFYNGCALLKREYPQILEMKIEFLYGSTLSFFKNFIEDNDVTHIVNQDDCSAYKINKSSIDPAILIKKCGLPVLSVDKRKRVRKTEKVLVHEEMLAEASM
ncbi:MAG: hypothetical protein EOP54_25520 [Sphingobacteriales bacterium]|nr:MAG: hypothetical protein EOP54_25520 [Sphingobacteriales bacterium]